MLQVHEDRTIITAKFIRCLLAVIIAITLVLSGMPLRPPAVRAEGTTITWVGTSEGDWHTPGNWNLGREPVVGDTVVIPELTVVECVYGSPSVTLKCAGNLTVSGGTLNLTGDSTLTGGKLDGIGAIAISGSGSKLSWTGGDIQGSGDFILGAETQLFKDIDAEKTITRPLDNAGEVTVKQNALKLTGGSQGSGDFRVYGGKMLEFAGGTYTIDGNLVDLGNCAYMRIKGSETNVTFNGSYNIVNTTVESGTTAIWNGTSSSMGVFNNNGNAIINSNLTLKDLHLMGGTISGSGNILIDDSRNAVGWTGGTLGGTGTLTVSSKGSFPITGYGVKDLNRNLINNGNIYIAEKPPTVAGTTAFINKGSIQIDACDSSELTVASYSQTATGSLRFDIYGENDFTELKTNAPSLAGNLDLNFVNYSPAIGTTFDLLTYSVKPNSNLQFSSVSSNLIGKIFQQTYSDNKLTLTVEQAEDVAGPPQVTAYTPANGAHVSVNTDKLVLKFNEPVWGVEDKWVDLCDSSGEPIYSVNAGALSVTGNGTDTITIPFGSIILAADANYCVKIDEGAFVDAAGNPYAGINDTTTWTFTTVPASNKAEINAFSFEEQTGQATINSGARTIKIEVAQSTDVTDLVATFALSDGASAKVGDVPQISGTTANNFTNPVTYVVTAEDGSTTKNWTVTVTKADAPPANDESFWQCRSPKPTPYALSEVKYVNGKFIAVGNNGTILSSIDGENWDSLDLGSKDRLQGIAYGNGKYVTVGYYTESESVAHGVIYESSDGETWHKVRTLSNQKLMDIVFGGGRFAAVGHGDKIITSSDGLTWETKAVGDVSIYLNSITYANSVYVAVGGYYGQGHIVTSNDGENWTKQTSVSDALEDVTFGNGKFVAVTASNVSPGIYTSVNNGESWTKKTASTPLFTVDYDGNRFIAAGNDSWGASSYVFTSTDGTTWTGGNVPIGAIFWAVASGGGKYVGVGGIGNIVISTDGTNWAWVTSGTVNDLLDVAYNGSIFVSVGEKGTIQTSPDGITWTVRDSGSTEYLRSVECLNGQFIAVGNGGVILTSADGETWTKQTSGINRALYDVTYGNSRYVAVGGVDNDVIILTSPDGATWTPATHNCKVYFTTVTYGSGTFVALTHYGGVFTSSGGVAWSSTTSLPGRARYAEDIIYAGGRFVGTGGYGEIYISDDNGVTWTVKEKVFGEYYIYSVAYGGGNLVAVTQNGKILISFDKGDTWEQQISGFENQRYLYGVVAGSSNFMAVGSAGLTLQSKDFGTPGNPDADAVAADKTALTWNSIKGGNITQDNVTANLVNPLPMSGASGTTISWSVTPDAGWIDTGTGVVTRPTSVQGDQTVTLTATITKGSASDSKSFTLTIKATAPEQTADEAIALDLAALTWNVIKGSNSSQTNVTANLILPARGANGTTISWSVSPDDGSINTTTGKVTRPASGRSDAQVTLTATISKEGGISKTKDFSLTIPALPSSSSGSGSGGSSVKTYTITATAGTGGKISPEGDVSVKKSNQKNFTIKAKDDYIILDVEIDGKSIGPVETYTFKNVDKNHTIKATFEKERPKTDIDVWDNPFIDVSEQDWYYETIRKIWGKGLMNGTASDRFSPELNATRAMIITILYRLESEPEVVGDSIFSDVPAGTWYTDAVIWATKNNITTGYGSGEFGSEDSITREQLAALLYRYSQYKGFNTGNTGDLSAFTDADQLFSWAEAAVKWAVGSGIITGKPGGVLDPKGKATRAEIATMLSRFIEKHNLL